MLRIRTRPGALRLVLLVRGHYADCVVNSAMKGSDRQLRKCVRDICSALVFVLPLAACHGGIHQVGDAGPNREAGIIDVQLLGPSEDPVAVDASVDAGPLTEAGSVDVQPVDIATDATEEAASCKAPEVAPGTLLWAQSTPASLAMMAPGACDDVFLLGISQNPVTFAGQQLPGASFLTHVGGSGAASWVRSWTAANTGILDMAGLPGGRLMAVGQFAGPVDFGGPQVAVGNSLDAFVTRYDAQGDLLSFVQYGNEKSQWADSVATNGAGDALVVANGYGTADFGTGALALPAMVLFASDGHVKWARQFPVPLAGSLLALDDRGTATIVSGMNGPIDLGGAAIGSAMAGAAQNRQFFVASFDAAGTLRWSKAFTNGSVTGLAALSNGDLAMTGGALAPATDTPPFDMGCGLVNTGVFSAKLSSGGICQWIRTLTATEHPNMAVIGDDLVLAGRALGTPVDPELGPLPGSGTLFVERISAAGTVRWSRVFGQLSPGNIAAVYAIAASPAAIWISGPFSGILDLGNGAMVSTSQNTDSFLAQLAP